MHRQNSGAALAGDLMLAPMVAMMRLPVLAGEVQNFWPWRAETLRAVSEKVAAAGEGAMAAQLSMLSSAASFWPDVLSGKVPALYSGAAMERVVHAALVPAGKRVRANFRRLSGKR